MRKFWVFLNWRSRFLLFRKRKFPSGLTFQYWICQSWRVARITVKFLFFHSIRNRKLSTLYTLKWNMENNAKQKWMKLSYLILYWSLWRCANISGFHVVSFLSTCLVSGLPCSMSNNFRQLCISVREQTELIAAFLPIWLWSLLFLPPGAK